ncbi:hypothetical protein ABZ845_12870 [Streptomyces sp. NPDC047022]|uniref:hypothetical protein n=1 Tax=Streptomyces sp. NPDC047022 TaxID=3155737 RepID=UPI0033FEB9B4
MGRRGAQGGGRPGSAARVAVTAGVLLAGPCVVPAYAVTSVGCTDADLIAAINASNGMAGGDTLSLASYCVYTLTDADGTLPTITQPLTVHGNNATIRRDPAATTQFRIFAVGASSLTMDTLTVMNGDATSTGGDGGGVLLSTANGSLSTTDVNFQGNVAENGGAVATTDDATVSLTGGALTDNRADGDGGAVYGTAAGTVTLSSVTVQRNRAASEGGGVSLTNFNATNITNSVISDNTAVEDGGGVQYGGSTSSTLSISGSRITDNRVIRSQNGGGGLFNDPEAGAGATLTNTLVSGNLLTGFDAANPGSNLGAGILHREGTLTLNASKVAGNQIVGAGGQGAGIALWGSIGATDLNLNSTSVTGNLASGRYSQGGGLYTSTNTATSSSVTVTDSHIDRNKVTGTGSAAGGIYNVDTIYSFITSSVNDNIAPMAPAPGGVYTGVAITSVDGATTFMGNTPTNCLFSPQPVMNCTN